MTSARTGAQAVAFPSGPLAHQVLVAGGMTGSAKRDFGHDKLTITATSLNTAQLFVRSTGKFTTTDAMTAKRVFHTATLLKTGKVLVSGGYTTSTPLKTAELYNPTTKMFTAAGTMSQGRAMHTATLLSDGKVLVVGGINTTTGATIGTAELYDPATNKFSKVTSALPGGLTVAGHTATLLSGCSCTNDGQVLIAGGFTGFSLFDDPATESASSTLVLYDPKTKKFTKLTAKLADDRMLHTASLVAGGKVLFAGGIRGQARFVSNKSINGLYGAVRNTAEIFDAKTKKVACVGTPISGHCPVASGMKNSRAGHSATVLTSGALKGQVLLAGGFGRPGGSADSGQGNILATAELFNPATKTFTATGAMKVGRAFHSAVLVQ